MSIFPFVQPVAETSVAGGLALCREIAWDFASNKPIFRHGKPVTVAGAEAVAVWAYKALRTARYRFEAYTRNYGQELETLVGKSYTEALKQAEAVRVVKDCLLINPYITAVKDTNVELTADHLTISCRIETIYGEVEVDV